MARGILRKAIHGAVQGEIADRTRDKDLQAKKDALQEKLNIEYKAQDRADKLARQRTADKLKQQKEEFDRQMGAKVDLEVMKQSAKSTGLSVAQVRTAMNAIRSELKNSDDKGLLSINAKITAAEGALDTDPDKLEILYKQRADRQRELLQEMYGVKSIGEAVPLYVQKLQNFAKGTGTKPNLVPEQEPEQKPEQKPKMFPNPITESEYNKLTPEQQRQYAKEHPE